jgi:hypothetical protein
MIDQFPASKTGLGRNFWPDKLQASPQQLSTKLETNSCSHNKAAQYQCKRPFDAAFYNYQHYFQ